MAGTAPGETSSVMADKGCNSGVYSKCLLLSGAFPEAVLWAIHLTFAYALVLFDEEIRHGLGRHGRMPDWGI